MRRVFSRVGPLLLGTFVLLCAAEAVLRVKYFYSNGHDWRYLTAPFFGWTAQASSEQQMEFRWPQPCVSGKVYSTARGTALPRTWDENCFRGDRVSRSKPSDEYRVFIVGGSTVQDFQSDEEMMTAQVKRALPPTIAGRHVTVVNAGRSGFNSTTILDDYRRRVAPFSPDLVVYYEAWNEMPTDVKPMSRVEARVGRIRNRLHKALHYRSMLYTYIVEKRMFMAAGENKFWKVDLAPVTRNLPALVDDVRRGGARFVLATQVVRMPRTWKSVDTFDEHAVGALIDRLKADRGYTYDLGEISMLNQRLALAHERELCRRLGVPVVDAVSPVAALDASARDELFMDLVHLTIKGDRTVGQLIGGGLGHSN